MPRSQPTRTPARTNATAEQARRLMDAVLAIPCPRHQAQSGEPCYVLPFGVCRDRVNASGVRHTRRAPGVPHHKPFMQAHYEAVERAALARAAATQSPAAAPAIVAPPEPQGRQRR